MISGQSVWPAPPRLRPASNGCISSRPRAPRRDHGHHHRRPGELHPDRAVLRGPRQRTGRRPAARLAARQPLLGAAGAPAARRRATGSITYDRRGFGRSSRPTERLRLRHPRRRPRRAAHRRSTCATPPWSGSRSAPASWPATSARYGTDRLRGAACSSRASRRRSRSPPTTRTGVDQAGVDGVQQAILDDRFAWLTGLRRRLPQPRRLPRQAGQRGDRRATSGTPAPTPRRYATWACPPAWLEDFSDDIKRIDIPTLILHGTADRILSIEARAGACTPRCPTRSTSRSRAARTSCASPTPPRSTASCSPSSDCAS